MIKNCKICGKEFDAKTCGKCCSEECRKENYRIADQKRNKSPERVKSKRETTRARLGCNKDKTCVVCGSVFSWKGDGDYGHRLRKTCSERCSAERGRERDRAKARTPIGRIKKNMKSRLISLIKKGGKKTDDFIGCNGEDFIEYLVHHYSWKPWFDLENYGEVWHIDHIRPLASFDLTNDDQVKQAFHYTNCQPLCAKVNISKSSKWNGVRHYHDK